MDMFVHWENYAGLENFVSIGASNVSIKDNLLWSTVVTYSWKGWQEENVANCARIKYWCFLFW